MKDGQQQDNTNNCYFSSDTKQSILDDLSLVEQQLKNRDDDCDDLLGTIGNVVKALKGGDFKNP